MKEFSFEIKKHIATLSDSNGYSLQLNLISFNGGAPKVDLRRWKDGKMLKGISITAEEAEALKRALCEV